MSKRRRVALIVLAALALTLVVGAIRSGRMGSRHDRRFEAWLVAAPCDFAVDLSTPGVWRAPFDQTCSMAHNEGVRLRAQNADGNPIEDRAALDGLEGSLRIVDSAGAVVAESPLPGSAGTVPPPQGAITLATLVPFRNGPCHIEIEVASGAPALAGAQQRITADYELCGVERLPAQIGRLLSGGMWVAAVVAGLAAAIVGMPQRAYPEA